MEKLIIIEDSKFFLRVLMDGFRGQSDIEVVTAQTYQEAKELISKGGTTATMALVDLNLPDATDGEAVDLTLTHGIPTVIFSSNFDEDTRKRYLDRGVLDFVLKDNPTSLDYLLRLVRRVIRNHTTEVLVVDDSPTALKLCANLLRRYKLIVHEAKSGKDAFQKLANNENIRLLITDYEMPEMNGFELATKARQMRGRDQLAIIGVSARGGAPLSARFLKQGANDFISKPYLPEELYTRVAQNLDALDNIEELTKAATRDFLTGLYNRRSFFDLGDRIASVRRREGKSIAVAMLDIDHFKSVNDTHGHDVGDIVLRAVAGVIQDHVNRGGDVCARLGGEEFAIILETNDEDATLSFVENIREAVHQSELEIDGSSLKVTASFGITFSDKPELEEMLKIADAALYAAKEGGRNQVQVG